MNLGFGWFVQHDVVFWSQPNGTGRLPSPAIEPTSFLPGGALTAQLLLVRSGSIEMVVASSNVNVVPPVIGAMASAVSAFGPANAVGDPTMDSARLRHDVAGEDCSELMARISMVCGNRQSCVVKIGTAGPVPADSPDSSVKRELLQPMGAFKIRGAVNAIAALDPEVRAGGVLAHSSSNHAQAVAMAARFFGIDAHIVIPDNAPPRKIAATEALGATVELVRCSSGSPGRWRSSSRRASRWCRRSTTAT